MVIALSAAMLPTRQMPWLNIAIRDVAQMLVAGVIFPLLYLRYQKESTSQKWASATLPFLGTTLHRTR